MEKNNGRNIDRREGVPTVNRKLACPDLLWHELLPPNHWQVASKKRPDR